MKSIFLSKFSLILIPIVIPSMLLASVAQAAEEQKEVSLGIAQQIGNFYSFALGIGGLVALGVLIFGGILYTTSAGNASRQEDAKQWITGSIVGLILLFGSWFILNTINPDLLKLKNLDLPQVQVEAAKAPQAARNLNLPQLVGNLYQWALGISGLLALGILVYAGLLYITAGGNASRQGDAKQWIWNALVGLGLLFSSYLILNTINPNLTKFQNLDLSQVKVGQVTGVPEAAKNLDLSQLIGNFYQWALGIGGIIALGIIIFGGILYTISPGNSSRQGDAKTWIMSALLGLVLLFGSYAILNTVNPDLTKLTNLRSSLDEIGFSAPASSPAAPLEPLKPGEKVPLGIPQQIGNFYQWALGIGGLLALGVLIFGGILYTTSAGNASRQDDAKQWLSGALIGIILLFGSFLTLNTINPELTKLKDLELIVNEAARRVSSIDLSIPENLIGFKKELLDFLGKEDPGNAKAWFAIVGCESGYDANNKTYGTPDPAGACGLFQASCACRGNDCGVGDWQTQVQNARALLLERGPCYWDCADGRRNDGFNGYSLLRIDPAFVANKSCKWHY